MSSTSSTSTLRRARSTAPLAAVVVFVLFGLSDYGNSSVFCSASGTEAAMTPSRDTTAMENADINTPHTARERTLRDAAGGVHVEPFRAAELSSGKDETSPAAPEQVHIALAVTDSREEYAMSIAWATWPEAQSQVLWGSSADQLSNLAEGTATCALILLVLDLMSYEVYSFVLHDGLGCTLQTDMCMYCAFGRYRTVVVASCCVSSIFTFHRSPIIRAWEWYTVVPSLYDSLMGATALYLV